MHLLGCAVQSILQSGGNLRNDLVKDRVVLSDTASVNIRAGHHALSCAVNDGHDRYEALFTQDAAVLQVALGDLTDGAAVNVQVLAGNLAHHGRHAIAQVHDGAGLAEQHVLLRNAGLHRQVTAGNQVANLAVNRHNVLRLKNVVAVQQLTGGSVTGNVNLRVALVHHVSAQLHEGVNDAEDAGLVTGNQRGCKHHGIAGLNLNLVVTVRHARQCRHRLALRTGAHHHNLVGTVVVNLLQVHQHVRGNLQVAQLLSNGHVTHHRAAHEHDLAATLSGCVQYLLHAVNVRGEGRHNNAAACVTENVRQHRTDVLLGRGEAGNLSVGGVRQEQVHALLAQASKVAQVGQATIQRQLVHLEVTGVQDLTRLGADVDSQRIRNRVVHSNELALERTETLHLVLLHREGVGLDAVLGELRLNQRQGQFRTDQGDVGAAAQQVGNRADVVLVAVGQNHGDHVVQTVNNVAEVGQDQVHAGLGLFGEEHAAVNNQQLAVDFVHGHVTTDFAQAAQGHHAQGVLLQAGREGKIRFKDAHRVSPLSSMFSCDVCDS